MMKLCFLVKIYINKIKRVNYIDNKILETASRKYILTPVAFRINHEYNDHIYFIEMYGLPCGGAKWYVRYCAIDPSAYIADLKDGYNSADEAIEAWNQYMINKYETTQNY